MINYIVKEDQDIKDYKEDVEIVIKRESEFLENFGELEKRLLSDIEALDVQINLLLSKREKLERDLENLNTEINNSGLLSEVSQEKI